MSGGGSGPGEPARLGHVTDASPPREALPPFERSSRLPWFGLAALALALGGGAVMVIASLDRGAVPPFLQPGASTEQSAPTTPGPQEAIRVAGTGSAIPVTRALAVAFGQHGRARPVVHASIGSGGGVRALLDGVIDLALISRPLNAQEKVEGLVAIPYARVPVMVAVNGGVPERGLDSETLLDIFRGKRTEWSDGSRIVVLQREQGDSSHAAVSRRLPVFDEINDQAYREGRWRVLYHDASMKEALENTAGAIGLHGTGAISSPQTVRALSIDGIAPTVENVASGAYPFTKELSFVTRGEPRDEVRAFIEFAQSDEGQRIIWSYGCLPLPEGER